MAFGNEVFLFLLLAISWTFADARILDINEISDVPVGHRIPKSQIPSALDRNEQICMLCEEYTAMATNYLKNNKTQTEIIQTLHQACSELHSVEQKCVILVDYYALLFFSKIGRIQPETFCSRVNLCERTPLFLPERDDTCALCHQVVLEILAKLKDPDSQLGIIQMLLQECNKLEHYGQECKRLVFRYGPLILANGEKFLESTDICASIHACTANREYSESAIVADAIVFDA